MEFTLDEEHRELQDLVVAVLSREVTVERLEAHDAGDAPYDAELWKTLAQAEALGACLPEEAEGAGLGALGLAVTLREIGAHVAPVPAYASLALAALPLAWHGTADQRALLGPLVDGESVLTGASREPGDTDVVTTARPVRGGHVLDGAKTFVPYAEQASHILVPARTPEGVGVFLVEPSAVELTPQPAATGEPMSRVGLAGVRVDDDALLGGAADGAAWATLAHCATAGAVATVSGVLGRALTLTTEHVRTREQFGRSLAEFQAVTMQVGDVYIAERALDVTMWAGAWRLAESYDDVGEVLAVAAYNACGPALRALYTCQHLHGGLGLDVTYPLHRYFAWGKHYAHLLGGAEAQLDLVGAHVARSVEA